MWRELLQLHRGWHRDLPQQVQSGGTLLELSGTTLKWDAADRCEHRAAVGADDDLEGPSSHRAVGDHDVRTWQANQPPGVCSPGATPPTFRDAPALERPDRTATSRPGARGIETGSYGARHRFVARTSVVRPHCRRSARNRPLRATVGPTWVSMAGKEDWAATVSRPSKLSLAAQSRIPAMLTQEWVCW